MPETATISTDNASGTSSATGAAVSAPMGFLARVIGVLVAPRATYAEIAARPRVLGALVLSAVVVGGAYGWFASTDVGRNAMLDQAESMFRRIEAAGAQVPDQIYSEMERRMLNEPPYRGMAAVVVVIPISCLIVAGILFGVFNALMGGDAKFKQVLAIVAFAGVVLSLQTLVAYPVFYMKGSMDNPTSLAVLLPFLDPNTFIARFLGAFDFFRVWWVVSLAIGMGVLYNKKTSPIATTLLVAYSLVALVYAGVATAFSGA